MKKNVRKLVAGLAIGLMISGVIPNLSVRAAAVVINEPIEESVDSEEVQTESEILDETFVEETETNESTEDTEVMIQDTENSETEIIDTEYNDLDMSQVTWDDVPSMGWDDPENGQCEKQSAQVQTYDEGIALLSESAARKVKARGIDVSSHNGSINWKKVKADGVDFAIIRVGGRGYGAGTLYKDDYAQKNIEGALAAGIKVGVYFFSTAINENEALDEAKYTCSVIKNYHITYPVVFDHEGYDNKNYRNYGLSKSLRTSMATTFLDYVESQGYEGMLYSSAGHFEKNSEWETNKLEKMYPIWVAQYWLYKTSSGAYKEFPSYAPAEARPTTYTGKYSIWQFSSQGKVNGIDDSNVDMDLEYYDDGNVNTGNLPTITGASMPETLKEGENFLVKGQIQSDTTMSSVVVGIYTTKNSTVSEKKISPNANTYDLSDIKESIGFEKLSSGIYCYRVVATNAAGSQVLTESYFTVLSSSRTVQDDVYYIKSSLNTDYVLSVDNDSMASGANIHLWQMKDYVYMKFAFEYQADGWYKIRNLRTGKYLGVANEAANYVSNVEQQDKGTLWQVILDESGEYYLIPQCNTSCTLDLAGGKIENGGNVQMYKCNYSAAQRWQLASIYSKATLTGASVPGNIQKGKSFSIRGTVKSNTKLTSVSVGVYNAKGTQVIGKSVSPNTLSYDLKNFDESVKFGNLSEGIYQYKVTATNTAGSTVLLNQIFAVLATGKTVADGTYYIESAVNNQYTLSIKDDSKTAGANVHLWSKLDNAYMKFVISYQSDGYYKIKDVGSGYYLGVAGQSASSGANVEQSAPGTLWQILPDSTGGYYFVPKCGTKNCLDLSSGQTVNGKNIQVYKQNMTIAQRWKLVSSNSKATLTGASTPGNIQKGKSFSIRGTIKSETKLTSVSVGVYNSKGTQVIGQKVSPNTLSYDLKNLDTSIKFGNLSEGIYQYKIMAANAAGSSVLMNQVFAVLATGQTVANGTYYIESAVNNQYTLSIKDDSKASGANVHLWSKLDNAYMKFVFDYQSDGYYKIKDVGSGKYLGVAGQSSSSGANVEQSTSGTLWQILPDSTGGYYFIPKCAGKNCLDLSGGQAAKGKNIQVYKQNMTTAQRWKLSKIASKPTITGQTVPGTMKQGSSFSIRGTVHSDSQLKSVSVEVYNAKNVKALGKTVTPKSTSYDLKNLDTSIKFGKLSKGTYTYKVTAVNSAGTAVLINHKFTVK